jgi:capsular polysaccharide transport system permease protein
MTDATTDPRPAPPPAEAPEAASEAAFPAPARPNVRPVPAAGPQARPGRPGARAAAAAAAAGAAESNVRPLAPKGPAPARPRPQPVPPPRTKPARSRPRHHALLASFLLLVLLPLGATIGYLWGRAAPEYHSETAFSIRSEEVGSAAAGLLGAITQIGSGSASDTDILYDFIRSQEIVERVDARLDLRTIWNRAENDPVFTLGDDTSTEALLEHWRRMVEVNLESSEGILNVTAFAFTPDDARAITREILAESDALVNTLSETAREDAVSFARAELAEVEGRLRGLRQDMADFRREHRMIDPSGDVAGQAGLLNALQGELAQALVERDMLLSYADPADQRVVQAERRIAAIEKRIEAERSSLQAGGTTSALPEVVGAYEELRVDLEFASTAYTQAMAGLAAAQAEASRQSRYLVPHVQPTLAETPLYPRRVLIAGMAGLFLFLGWSVLMLVYYNVRDNR